MTLADVTPKTFTEAALAVVILLLLWIVLRLGRIARLLRADRDFAKAKSIGAAGESQGRYMREDTLAEFLQRQEQEKR